MTFNLENYTIDEDSNGDLIIQDPGGATVMRWDDGNSEWNLENNAFTNLSLLSTGRVDYINLAKGSTSTLLDALTAGTDGPQLRTQTTDSVDDTFTDILALPSFASGLIVVYGQDTASNDEVTELILRTGRGTPSVIHTETNGTPPSTSYQVSSDILQLSFGSSVSYDVVAFGLVVTQEDD